MVERAHGRYRILVKQAHVFVPVAALAAHMAKADQLTINSALSPGMDDGKCVWRAVAVRQAQSDIICAAPMLVDFTQEVGVFVGRESLVDPGLLQVVFAVPAEDVDMVGDGDAHKPFITALAVA